MLIDELDFEVRNAQAESLRVRELEHLLAVVEDNETSLQSMVKLLATLCKVPFAGVSLVDSDTVWIKAHYGLEATCLPREGAFCAAAVDSLDDLYVVENALDNPLFAHNPLVAGAPEVRFYAAYPFKGMNGFAIGTLWMFDTQPTALGEDGRLILKSLGAHLEQLINQQYHCPVTGLANRQSFLKQLQALMNSSTQKVNAALVRTHRILHVTGIYGAEFRDRLIALVAERLGRARLEKGLLAHLGDGCFAFAWVDGQQKAELVAALHDLETPLTIGNVTVSVALSMVSVSAEPQQASAAALMEIADEAAAEMQHSQIANIQYQEKIASNQIAMRVRACLFDDQPGSYFYPEYQPQVDVSTGRIVGFEALLRWHDAMYGTTPVWKVIELVESLDMISTLDFIVVRKVCADIAEWQAAGTAVPKVSVNLSRTTLQTEGLADKLVSLLREYDVEPSALTLEITESGQPLNDKVLATQIASLHRVGFSIAIDDFGTGMSNLSTLKNTECKLLKVDRQFVHGVACNTHMAALLRLIKGTAESLGVSLLVEGVEAQDDLDWLLACGIYLIQGWYFSKSCQAKTIPAMLAADRAVMLPPSDLQTRAEALKCLFVRLRGNG